MLNMIHNFCLHGIYTLMEDRQEQCIEISYVMGKCTVVFLCEHQGANTDLQLGVVTKLPGGTSF